MGKRPRPRSLPRLPGPWSIDATATEPGAKRNGASSIPCSTMISVGVSVSWCSPLGALLSSFFMPPAPRESGTVTVVLGGGGALTAATLPAYLMES